MYSKDLGRFSIIGQFRDAALAGFQGVDRVAAVQDLGQEASGTFRGTYIYGPLITVAGVGVAAFPWSGMSGRTFTRWLESLETRAAQTAGTAGKLSGTETRALLQQLQRQGWKIYRGVETNWVGGSHINIVGPSGGPNIHLPVPDGFVP